VSLAASSINFASMFSVVLICINMYLRCISVKGKSKQAWIKMRGYHAVDLSRKMTPCKTYGRVLFM
jgi:hypothetical protein